MNRSAARLQVWDAPVRLLHWALVGMVTLAAVTSQIQVRFHAAAGCVTVALLLLRILWGVCGGRYTRFTQFVRAPRAVWHYMRQLQAGREPRFLGHNPLGAWMAIALMGCIAALAFTGWLYTTEAFWGEAWLDRLHAALARSLLVLVLAHIAGVAFTSWRHRENLVAAMLRGDKPAPTGDDVF